MPRPSSSSDARKPSVWRSSIDATGTDGAAARLAADRELQPATATNKLTHATAARTESLGIEADFMPTEAGEQTATLLVGVDVGGTFTDLVAFDPATGELRVVKVPSTPPD